MNLSSSNTNKATVPATVIIPAGQNSATFALSAIDNTIIDGNFTVIITASSTGLLPATANVIVTDNDTVTPPANQAPVAQNQSVTTNQNTPKTLALLATDANNDALTFSIVTPPANGTLSGTAANLTYTPKTDFVGTDTFTFKANDGKADSNVATVTVHSTCRAGRQHAAGRAEPKPVHQTEHPAFIGVDGDDANNDALTFRVVIGPRNGKLSGSAANLTYTPNNGFSGTDSFTFVANDGKADSNIATITVQVLAVVVPRPGALQFSAPTYSVNESGPVATTTITRTGGSDGAISVQFATSNGSATAGQDYTATTQTVTFAAGDAANKTVTVPITNDTLVEGNETVNLALSSPTGGATLGAQKKRGLDDCR